MDTVLELASWTGIRTACDVLGVARPSLYRLRPIMGPVERAMCVIPEKKKNPPARSLSAAERVDVLVLLHSPRFQDQSPAAVQTTRLDEGIYDCSIRTMYRLLADSGETREHRAQLTHPPYESLSFSPLNTIRSGVGTSPR